jgi:DNA-binding NarL/FixJ family response regulator
MPADDKKFRVLLADDHALVRAGIRMLLEKLTWVEVVGEASDGREAMELTRSHKPDLILADISMAGLNGLELADRIAKEFPKTRVIILSMHSNEQYVTRALRGGAAGYLLKDAAQEELELALRTVRAGQTYLSAAISRQVIERHLQGEEDNSGEKLTSRQREILQLIAEGKNTKEIASVLGLSAKTVEAHRAQLMERLKIRDVPGLVRYAIREGLITAEE